MAPRRQLAVAGALPRRAVRSAAIGACVHGSDGGLRRRQVRWLVAVGVLTVAALLIGTIAGPEGYYSWDDR